VIYQGRFDIDAEEMLRIGEGHGGICLKSRRMTSDQALSLLSAAVLLSLDITPYGGLKITPAQFDKLFQASLIVFKLEACHM